MLWESGKMFKNHPQHMALLWRQNLLSVGDGHHVMFMPVGRSTSLSHWQQPTVQRKTITHWLQSNKLPTVLNFLPLFWHLWEIIFNSVPLRCLLKSCQCSKKLRLMLPYFSDKTGKGAVFFFHLKYNDPLQTYSQFFCGLRVSKTGFTQCYKAKPEGLEVKKESRHWTTNIWETLTYPFPLVAS